MNVMSISATQEDRTQKAIIIDDEVCTAIID